MQSIKETEENTKEPEIPKDLFDFIIGQDGIKKILWQSILAPRPSHIFLVGPPAGSKSMFLSELARLPFSRFTNGGGTSKAGLADYLLEFHPRFLIIDEIDKMVPTETSVLLSLMEDGTVTRLKKRMRETEKMLTTVYAAANRDQHIWPELKSRFFTIQLKEYSKDEFVSIAVSVLIKREKVDPALAKEIASSLVPYTRDIRKAIQFGRLAKNSDDVKDLIRLCFPKK